MTNPAPEQSLAHLVSETLRNVESRFAEASGMWGRPKGVTTIPPAPATDAIESGALAWLRSGTAGESEAIAVLRIAGDIHRINGLVDELARRLAQTVATKDEDLFDHLRRMSNLTSALLAASANGLLESDPAQAERVLTEADTLDAWYDMLLAEMLDDLHENRDPDSASIAPVLSIARILERIGDHAHHVAQCTRAVISQ